MLELITLPQFGLLINHGRLICCCPSHTWPSFLSLKTLIMTADLLPCWALLGPSLFGAHPTPGAVLCPRSLLEGRTEGWKGSARDLRVNRT